MGIDDLPALSDSQLRAMPGGGDHDVTLIAQARARYLIERAAKDKISGLNMVV
ncbi:hypothetical protein ACFXO9_27265 [Nocardia tengchongensis]|uniref:hypothetical protein n=1 Tax=Nocardia tengchongensis TaxID=2055889 RepID=UPI0036937F84